MKLVPGPRVREPVLGGVFVVIRDQWLLLFTMRELFSSRRASTRGRACGLVAKVACV
jgi:hypothetical protein